MVDQALNKLPGTSRRGFVVIVRNLEVIALVADLYAAGFVDLLDGEFVAVLGVVAVRSIDATLADYDRAKRE